MRKRSQQPTANSQRPTPKRDGVKGCRMFLLAFLFCLGAWPLQGQTGGSETNGPLKLIPPYGELPPTFLEQHGTSMAVAGIGVSALVAFGFWLVLRPKQKAIIPPDLQARQALETLRQQPEDGEVLSQISQVMRHYFIAAFQLPVGEFTTAEFSRVLSGHEPIGAELSATVIDFLRNCDAQKFSAATASAPLKAADQALTLIERAEQRRAQLRQLAATSTQGRRA